MHLAEKESMSCNSNCLIMTKDTNHYCHSAAFQSSFSHDKR